MGQGLQRAAPNSGGEEVCSRGKQSNRKWGHESFRVRGRRSWATPYETALPRVSESGWALRHRPQLCDADLVFARFLQSNLTFSWFLSICQQIQEASPSLVLSSVTASSGKLPNFSLIAEVSHCLLSLQPLPLFFSICAAKASTLCLFFVACVETVI